MTARTEMSRTHLVRAKQKDVDRRDGEVALLTQLSQHIADVVARTRAHHSGGGVWHHHAAKLHCGSRSHRLCLQGGAQADSLTN